MCTAKPVLGLHSFKEGQVKFSLAKAKLRLHELLNCLSFCALPVKKSHDLAEQMIRWSYILHEDFPETNVSVVIRKYWYELGHKSEQFLNTRIHLAAYTGLIRS